MSENLTGKTRYELEADKEATKARVRALNRAKERDAVSEGFKAHTEGEKKFNDLTYTWVGYFGVTAFSVLMTYVFRDTKLFGPRFRKWGEDIARSVNKGKELTPEMIDTSQSWLRVGALFTGGSIMTVTGVKYLEDNKAKIVKHFDKEIYGEDVIKSDPEILAAHQIMEDQPKQTWASVGLSRVVAFGATISSLFLIGGNSGFISKHIGTSFDTLGLQFGRWGGRLVNKLKGNTKVVDGIEDAIRMNKEGYQPLEAGRKFAQGHSNLRHTIEGKDTQLVKTLSDFGTDGLYTVITSIGLFVSTRILAPVFDKVGLEKLSNRKDHKSEKVEPVRFIPADSLEHAPEAPEPAMPRVKVENVQAVDRLSKHAVTQTAGVGQ